MNQAQDIDRDIEDPEETSVTTTAGYRPDWWGFDPAIEDVTPEVVQSALNAFAPRIAAIGELIAATSDAAYTALADDTMLYVGQILRDYAGQAEALSCAVGRRARKQAMARKPDAPDLLEDFRTLERRTRSFADSVDVFRTQQARELHAKIVTEIEAGERDEEDRGEADALLAAALATSGVGSAEAVGGAI